MQVVDGESTVARILQTLTFLVGQCHTLHIRDEPCKLGVNGSIGDISEVSVMTVFCSIIVSLYTHLVAKGQCCKRIVVHEVPCSCRCCCVNGNLLGNHLALDTRRTNGDGLDEACLVNSYSL